MLYSLDDGLHQNERKALSNNVVVLEEVLEARNDGFFELIKNNSKLKGKITDLTRPDLSRQIQQLKTLHEELRLD